MIIILKWVCRVCLKSVATKSSSTSQVFQHLNCGTQQSGRCVLFIFLFIIIILQIKCILILFFHLGYRKNSFEIDNRVWFEKPRWPKNLISARIPTLKQKGPTHRWRRWCCCRSSSHTRRRSCWCLLGGPSRSYWWGPGSANSTTRLGRFSKSTGLEESREREHSPSDQVVRLASHHKQFENGPTSSGRVTLIS